MKKKTDAEKAREAKLSRSQLNEARAAGIDVDNRDALVAYRATINTRSDDRNSPIKPKSDADAQTGRMTIEDIEEAISQPDLSPNEARVLKIQLEGLKAAIALRQQMNQLISRAEVDERAAKIAHAMNAMFRRLENEIPPGVLGMSTSQSKPFIKEKIRDLQRLLEDEMSEFWESYPES